MKKTERQKNNVAPNEDEHAFRAARLSRLAEELESPAAARAYASAFLRMFPGRIQRIVNSLRDGDKPAAMDAVLSLKVNSHIVGALTICLLYTSPSPRDS